ncbi:MAG TPA: hypothetical protein PL001_09930 [Candidatus Kryptobacter bacterium]|nr:MAG: hypothetical protein B7Z63_03870 [Ignavibacteriae bacterium 37-53-5]HQT92330.1 hypothetical protein [Candidatus Kryptobacter bacterium]
MKDKLFLVVFAALIFASCEVNSGSTVVGSGNDTQISGVTFTVDTLYVDASGSGQLVARGLAKASSNISSPWYVEGQFYTDSTLTVKLGGNDTQIGVPLSPGQSTFWTIYFSTTSVDVRQFPNFRIGDLRAIYKN